MRKWVGFVAVTVIIVFASGVRLALAQEPDGDPGATKALVGDWVLNRALSDDPSERIPREPVLPGTGREPERRPSGAGPLRQVVERFSLSQTDSTVVIGYPDRDQVIYPDGKKHVDVINERFRFEYRAWREESSLVIERRRDHGMEVTERYSIVQGTGRLLDLTRVESDRLPQALSFVLVYDPASD
jgi:hypothetical protein